MVLKSKYPGFNPDPKYKNLVSNFFWSQLDKFERIVLFVDHETQRHWTGAQIKSTSARLAKNLIKHGFKVNDDCVILYKHCDYIQLATLGVMFAGGSVCVGRQSDPAQEHAYVLAMVKPKFVFVEHKLVDEMLRLRSAGRHNYTIVIMDDDEDSLDEPKFRTLTSENTTITSQNVVDQNGQQIGDVVVLGLHHDLLSVVTNLMTGSASLPIQVDPQRPAFMLFTSGSTGRPKPVGKSQRNCLYMCFTFEGAEELWDLNESSVVAAQSTLDHITGIFLLEHCLTRGYKSIIMNGYKLTTMLEAIQKHRISDVLLGSAHVHNLLISREVNDALSEPSSVSGLDSLRNIVAGGSAIASQSVVSQFMKLAPHCSVRQGYGSTEAGVLTYVPRELPQRQHDLSEQIVGYPSPNVELKIISGQKGHENEEITEPDQIGELYVRAPTVSPGYYGDQFRQQTNEVFLADGFHKTNDMCSFGSDGMLRVHGRYSEVLCLGDSYMVLPSEIERVIMEHPLIKVAAVVGVPNPKLPSCHAPRAYVVPRDGVAIDDDDSGDELFVVNENGSNGIGNKQENSSNYGNNNDSSNTDSKCNGSMKNKTISRRSVFEFVAERVAEYKLPIGGVKFMANLPTISLGKIDKRSLKAADGY